MAHIRHSRPDSGLGFLAKVLNFCQLFLPRSEAVAEIVRSDGPTADTSPVHPTECINYMVLECQLLPKIVKLLFTITD